MIQVAIVVGGAENALTEAQLAKELCASANVSFQFYVINDAIGIFPGEVIAVTLHPDKLQTWLLQRSNNKLPIPSQRWSNRNGKQITNTTRDWAGSSGLFAVKIALERGYRKILLAGVPMSAGAMHFVRHEKWNAASAFKKPWNDHLKEIAPFVRSFSGWTAELLGKPDKNFLCGDRPLVVGVNSQGVKT